MQMKWWRDNETHRPGLTQRTLLQLSPGSRSRRKTDRLSEAACCLNFWLQPSASLPVSFIFNDSVNLTPTFPSGVYMLVCVCVYVGESECVCVCLLAQQMGRENKERETGLNPYSMLDCHVSAPGLVLPLPAEHSVQLVLKCCVRSGLRRQRKILSRSLPNAAEEGSCRNPIAE